MKVLQDLAINGEKEGMAMHSRDWVVRGVLLSLIFIFQSGCNPYNAKDIEAFLKSSHPGVTTRNYILMPPDVIEIHCIKVPELHLQSQQIRPDGKISFESIGTVEVAGKTPTEVADILRRKVSSLYNLQGDSPIDVRVTRYNSQFYYVLGEVGSPGPKPYTGHDTALTAISLAGPLVTAWKERIRIIRPSGDEAVKPKIFEFNLFRVTEYGDTSQDVLLRKGDIIYVPPTIAAAIAQGIAEFVTPIGLALSPALSMQRLGTGEGF